MNLTEIRLAKVVEECVEVAQRATKAQRFGMSEVQADQHLANDLRILIEFAGLVAALELLYGLDIECLINRQYVFLAKEKQLKYEDYSKQLEVLHD